MKRNASECMRLLMSGCSDDVLLEGKIPRIARDTQTQGHYT